MRTLSALASLLATILTLPACTASTAEGGGSGDVEGLWTRLTADGSGDETDLAIGVIAGADPDRVWACEFRPSGPQAIIIKGTLRGNVVTWDPEYGNPDYVVERNGADLTLEVPSCTHCSVTRYESGSWNPGCGPLDESDTRIHMVFGILPDSPRNDQYITAASSDISCAAGGARNVEFGPCPYGDFSVSMTLSNGLSVSNAAVNLSRPPEGFAKRIYYIGFTYNDMVNRWLWGFSHVDIPDGAAAP